MIRTIQHLFHSATEGDSFFLPHLIVAIRARGILLTRLGIPFHSPVGDENSLTWVRDPKLFVIWKYFNFYLRKYKSISNRPAFPRGVPRKSKEEQRLFAILGSKKSWSLRIHSLYILWLKRNSRTKTESLVLSKPHVTKPSPYLSQYLI